MKNGEKGAVWAWQRLRALMAEFAKGEWGKLGLHAYGQRARAKHGIN